jgi:hypothetical protein
MAAKDSQYLDIAGKLITEFVKRLNISYYKLKKKPI